MDGALEQTICRDYWLLHDLASHGVAAPTGPTFTPAAPPPQNPHVQYAGYDHTHYLQDSLNIHLPVPPPSFESASIASSVTQSIPSKPGSWSDTQCLPDNRTNLEQMRHERELVFQKAATELDQTRRGTGPPVPSNKAWEDAWEVLRENMTKM